MNMGERFMKVAVIGAGIMGSTVAIYAARAGHQVDLFDKADRPMTAASWCNQWRFHQGQHYPRSPETGLECRTGNITFLDEYRDAVIGDWTDRDEQRYYAIAQEGSLTNADDYVRFLEQEGLVYERIVMRNPLFNPRTLALAVRVSEGRLDPHKLLDLVAHKLAAAGVTCHFGQRFDPAQRDQYDRIVIAAYAQTNVVARELGLELPPLQFEVVEKPVIQLPAKYAKTSVVVMDGPFCSLDPYGTTGQHLLGHVKYAIWDTHVGPSPIKGRAGEFLHDVMDKGIIPKPQVSAFAMMRKDAARFIPILKDAEHIGSMFTVRAVLPNVDATDKRPTIVRRLDDQVLSIFSGKIGTAVEAAKQAVYEVKR